ncbi:MAG: FHA domain-containing protein [Actinobacteria bacterium]|nr:FHA domain-containing protein [Actinomycetota bacterium]MCG2819280.1 FHA domain-containing protein [Actinomycetes bacterium]MBU4178905.1 FHA domain-containing protein [Actinomycetota bacterium]MBU4218087.1 FHA domain-containing protein [Actinomycetota bacterium]MBU4360203.1 FHA domain-containing protein [Actinomycetota bacterium]
MGFLLAQLVVAQADVEFLGGFMPGWAKVLIIIFFVLLAINLFIPFFLYADATRRDKNGIPWAAGAFFTMAILGGIGIALGADNYGVMIVFLVLAFLAPYVFLFVYLIQRAPLAQRMCPVCGRPLDPDWKTCPYCEEARTAAAGPAVAAGPVFVPPPVSQSPGTGAGRRSTGRDKSTMVRPREEKRTIRRKDKEAGPTLGWLVIKSGSGAGREYKITKELTNIGRETSNEIVISDDEMSRQHARLRFEGGKFVLYDLGSANGTYVNGEETQKTVMEDGDVIRVGETELTFKRV